MRLFLAVAFYLFCSCQEQLQITLLVSHAGQQKITHRNS